MQKIINIDWETGIKEVANNSVDLVLTDPPYGMSYQSNRRKEKHKSIKNDTNLDWLGQVFISEYNAPKDFKCIKEVLTNTQLGNGSNTGNIKKTDKLFVYCG